METVEKLTGILRNHGMKITPQRLMIFKVLENNTSHPSAEEVFKRVKRVYPTVSFTTIYKTLETLRDLGEVKELIIDEARKHSASYIYVPPRVFGFQETPRCPGQEVV